ncbi:MAG: hypothetical protein HYY18_08850 [Planctomycetes bacterium]|nr:hypothetical protein [Planctomycetota bacterium]
MGAGRGLAVGGAALAAAALLLVGLQVREKERGERDARARTLEASKRGASAAGGAASRAESVSGADAEIDALVSGAAPPGAAAAALLRIDPQAMFVALRRRWPVPAAAGVRLEFLQALAAGCPRLVDVLDLGMRDPEAAVRGWAAATLEGYAFEDFSGREEAYREWHARLGGLVTGELWPLCARACATRMLGLPVGQIPAGAERLRKYAGWPGRKLLVESRMAEVIEAWIRSGDADAVRAALGVLPLYSPEAALLTRTVLPLLESPDAGVYALGALGSPGNTWAIPKIVPFLRSGDPAAVEAAAAALAGIGDAASGIPPMIEAVLADTSGHAADTIGRAGLARLAGVETPEEKDLAWWQNWWAAEGPKYAPRTVKPPGR